MQSSKSTFNSVHCTVRKKVKLSQITFAWHVMDQKQGVEPFQITVRVQV